MSRFGSGRHFIGVLFHFVSRGIGVVADRVSGIFHGIGFHFTGRFYVVSRLLNSFFLIAFARSEGERSGSQGEEQYFFHLGVGLIGGVRIQATFEQPYTARAQIRGFIPDLPEGNPASLRFIPREENTALLAALPVATGYFLRNTMPIGTPVKSKCSRSRFSR